MDPVLPVPSLPVTVLNVNDTFQLHVVVIITKRYLTQAHTVQLFGGGETDL